MSDPSKSDPPKSDLPDAQTARRALRCLDLTD
jgi:hypothetical protein